MNTKPVPHTYTAGFKAADEAGEKYFIGTLCVNKHRFEGRAKSIRLTDNRTCATCKREANARAYAKYKRSRRGLDLAIYERDLTPVDLLLMRPWR